MKYLMSVYLRIILPLLGYELSNVGIFKYCLTIYNVGIFKPLLGYKISNVGIFKDRFTIIGL